MHPLPRTNDSRPVASDHEALAILSRQINALKISGRTVDEKRVPTGVPPLDVSLQGGLSLATTHEISGRQAASGFLCALLGKLPAGPIIWLTGREPPYPHGLASFGLDARRLIFAATRRERDLLWAMEESLKVPGIAAVVAEVSAVDLTATRRLQLAAEKGGGAGFLLRRQEGGVEGGVEGGMGVGMAGTACATRWRVMPAPSLPQNGLPGLGPPRWHVELLKARGGRPAVMTLEWRNGAFHAAAAPTASHAAMEARPARGPGRPGRLATG